MSMTLANAFDQQKHSNVSPPRTKKETNLMFNMDRAKRQNENKQEERASDSRKRQCQRYETAIGSSADELVCPLTLELPMDPVTAEDGKVYERMAIQEHIERNYFTLKSPVTNEPMGTRLFPALQVRNVIEALVRSGAIDGDKAKRWNVELDKQNEVAVLRQKAESGDTNAMYKLALRYTHGEGVKKDESLAYAWHEKASDGGHVQATAMAGWHHVINENNAFGMMLLGRAEQMGSELAAYLLGKWFCTGAHGLPQNPAQGKRFLDKVVHERYKVKHLGPQSFQEAFDLFHKLDRPTVVSPELN